METTSLFSMSTTHTNRVSLLLPPPLPLCLPLSLTVYSLCIPPSVLTPSYSPSPPPSPLPPGSRQRRPPVVLRQLCQLSVCQIGRRSPRSVVSDHGPVWSASLQHRLHQSRLLHQHQEGPHYRILQSGVDGGGSRGEVECVLLKNIHNVYRIALIFCGSKFS